MASNSAFLTPLPLLASRHAEWLGRRNGLNGTRFLLQESLAQEEIWATTDLDSYH